MPNIVKLKRTGVQDRHPLISSLELGELALNTFNGRIFMEKDIGTGNNEMMEFVPLADRTRIETLITTSTVGQTTFTLTNDPISSEYVLLFFDGVAQSFTDYSVVGFDVITTDPLPVGINISIFNFLESAPLGGAGVEIKDYIATGGQTHFTLDFTPASTKFVMVTIDGIVQNTSEYSISFDKIVITGGVPVNTKVRLVNFYEEVTGSNVVAVEAIEVISAAAQTVFTLQQQPSSIETIFISVGGAMQSANDFTIVNDYDITLNSPLPAGETVRLFSLRRISLKPSQDGGLF